MLHSSLSYLLWNPNRVVFYVPYFDHPVVWYGVLFALGFLVSYFILKAILAVEILSKISLDASKDVQWAALRAKLTKYPHVLPDSEDQNSCLQALALSIKTKKLPYSFYRSKILPFIKDSDQFLDSMTGYLIVGVIVGARLGYVFFYGWPFFRENPLDIFKIWEGGLASHGACIGILMALFLFVKRIAKTTLNFSYLHLLDVLTIMSGFFAFFIRMGNFVNQEIVGLASKLPWAVIFLNAFEGLPPIPRHPVQLYEAFFYLFIGLSLWLLWKKNKVPTGHGLFAAIFLITLFSFRFGIEFLKEPQGVVLPIFKGLRMGQYLSLPFILAGITILLTFKKKQQYKKSLL
ncbi:MAG: Phosphatidylglycerol--prolipoprotein diacylglyceryl transferase [Chlamydiae bacterium]|nr:Phosphatidylglycerol--prolipoprotein diacylglyceryl transferase [Chlamydiota bacterium]